MGNGNAEENAQDRQAAFKGALTGKHLPVLTLDNKWYRLLNKTGSVPLKETEDALNQLLKRQGKLNTESKDIRNLKKKLMKEIVPMVDEAEQQGENSKLNKQIEDHKRLIGECNHIQRIARIRTLQRNGIVKISGIRAVDGHGQKIAKILPLCTFPACDLLRHLLGLHQRLVSNVSFSP